jgi:WD40 repeat protein
MPLINMSKKQWAVGILVIFSLLMRGNAEPTTILAQPATNALIVTMEEPYAEKPHLAKYDLATGQFSEFYRPLDIDYNIQSIRALSWSPSGNYLAVLKTTNLMEIFPQFKICILEKTGVEKICLAPLLAPESPYRKFEIGANLTWAADEKFVYYVIVSPTDDTQRDLIEVSIETGQFNRVILSRSVDDVRLFSWLPSLDYVLFNADDDWRLDTGRKTGVFNVTKQTFVDVEELLKPYDSGSFLCPNFSPDGQYLMSQVYKDEQWKLAVISIDGKILHIVAHPEKTFKGITCPIWRGSDTKKFYFWSFVDDDPVTDLSTYNMYSYDMRTQTLEVVKKIYDKEPEMLIGRHVIRGTFSPDGVYWAVTAMTWRYDQRTLVITDNGPLIRLRGPYLEIGFPVWVPPQNVGAATPP